MSERSMEIVEVFYDKSKKKLSNKCDEINVEYNTHLNTAKI